MFWQLCAALRVADGEGVGVLAGAALAAAVRVLDEVTDDVLDVAAAEWLVAALATARLPPIPTPSAPAPTAVPMMIVPSLDLTVFSSWSGWSWTQETQAGCGRAAARLCRRYESSRQRYGRATVKTSWLACVASEPMPITAAPDGARALIW